ncbi:MAG: 2-C-methyl-D-erythritol 4-phosphate cytidylyltransferase [Ignavibacteria bacterium]|nr:2-C-methyl-D-erythritol 4-phosphate cytidylyltransferase [Ignavibacteria bacterium]
MIREKKVGVVVPAAGKGRRIGGSKSKQFLELDGKAIIVYTIEQFQSVPEVDAIVLVADAPHVDPLKKLINDGRLTKVVDVVCGGNERQDSVWNGLQALRHRQIDIVIVHDAVRPFIDSTLIRSVLSVAMDHQAAVVAVRPKETLKFSRDDQFIHETPRREQIWVAQTPQAFHFSVLYDAYEDALASRFYGTDDASLVERRGVNVKIVQGTYENIKITTPEDLELARLIARRRAQVA